MLFFGLFWPFLAFSNNLYYKYSLKNAEKAKKGQKRPKKSEKSESALDVPAVSVPDVKVEAPSVDISAPSVAVDKATPKKKKRSSLLPASFSFNFWGGSVEDTEPIEAARSPLKVSDIGGVSVGESPGVSVNAAVNVSESSSTVNIIEAKEKLSIN